MTQFALNFSPASSASVDSGHAPAPALAAPVKVPRSIGVETSGEKASLAPAAPSFDMVGFDIGWDYARYRLAPPADHFHAGHPVRQGWQAAQMALGVRTLQPSLAVAQWLQLRLQAWMHGRTFESIMVTPRFVCQLQARQCPVTREVLDAAPGVSKRDVSNPGVIVTLYDGAGVAAGNLAMVSARAAQAWHDAPSAFHQTSQQTSQRLLPEEARRLDSLRRMATPMSHAEAMAHPLTLLPPARVRLLNPAHALQVLLTRLLLGGAYARRMADVATLLPAAARRPYALLMNTLLARRLAPGWSASASSVRHALEDAWSHPLVLQRWAPFVQTLSRTQCERVVQRAIQRGWAGSGVRWLPEDQATDGWELPTAGRTHAASLAQTSQTSQTSHVPASPYQAQS